MVRSWRNKKTYGSNQSCWASTFFLVADWLTARVFSLLSTKGLLSLHSSLYSNQHFSLSFILTVVTSKVDFFQSFKRNSAPPQKVLLVYGQKIPIFLAHPPQKHVFQVGYQSKENWNFVPFRQKLHGKVFRKKKTKTREISQSFPPRVTFGERRKKSFFSILVLKSVLDGSAPSSQSKFSGTKRA